MDLIDRAAVEKIIDDLLENDNLQASPSVWHGLYMIKQLPSVQPEQDFISWLIDMIWDDEDWELNWQAFPEILCRKLVKFGYVRERNGEYERLDRQTGGDRCDGRVKKDIR